MFLFMRISAGHWAEDGSEEKRGSHSGATNTGGTPSSFLVKYLAFSDSNLDADALWPGLVTDPGPAQR